MRRSRRRDHREGREIGQARQDGRNIADVVPHGRTRVTLECAPDWLDDLAWELGEHPERFEPQALVARAVKGNGRDLVQAAILLVRSDQTSHDFQRRARDGRIAVVQTCACGSEDVIRADQFEGLKGGHARDWSRRMAGHLDKGLYHRDSEEGESGDGGFAPDAVLGSKIGQQ